MYNGSCLCGNVRYEISGRIHDIVCCHCSKCRKAQGSAFATNGNVKLEEFRFIRGEDGLCGYESSPGHIKFFCTSCGSPIMSKNDRFPDQVRIRLGTLESDISEREAGRWTQSVNEIGRIGVASAFLSRVVKFGCFSVGKNNQIIQ